MLSDELIAGNEQLIAIRDKRTINYEVGDEWIIRSYDTISDTFRFDEVSIEVSFEGQPALNNEIVDCVSITATVNEQELPYSYSKHYSVQQLIENSNGN